MSPAFIKELLRKAAMVAAGEGSDMQLIVTDAHVNTALDELLAETESLMLSLEGQRTDRRRQQWRAWRGPRSRSRWRSARTGRSRPTATCVSNPSILD